MSSVGIRRRPAITRPGERRDPQRRYSMMPCIVGVIHDVFAVAVADDAAATGPAPALPLLEIRSEDHGTAAIEHRAAIAADERAGHLAGTAVGGVIGAAHSLAAVIVGSEEVVIPAALEHEGAFDRVRRAGGLGSAGQRVRMGVTRGWLPGRGVEAPHADSAPEAAVNEPAAALAVHEMVGVDGIEVTALVRHEDEPVVLPVVLRAGRIERGVGRKPDDRAVGAESRDGIVEAVAAAENRDIGSPHALRAR